ncbi:MAG: hypothetical protein M1836_000242 [Candelina mexicana]|nr:MAG: hypothetical protein M1836_000242 [Candelina mexicana]
MPTGQIADGARETSAAQVLAHRFRRGSADTKNIDLLGDARRTKSNASTNHGMPELLKTATDLQGKFRAPLKTFKLKAHEPVKNPLVTSIQPSATLMDLFGALPNELHVQILCELPFVDILTLRMTSRSFLDLITISQSPIVRHHVKHGIPTHFLRIYPSPSPMNARLNYLIGLQYRLRVCSSLAGRLADFFSAETFGNRTESSRQKFQPQRDRMWRRMIPWLLVLFHFFESYRSNLIEHLLNRTEPLPSAEPDSPHHLQVDIISNYSPQILLVAHEIYRLLLRSFSRKLRPPTYAGRLERSIRGWKKPPPAEAELVKVLLAGGLPEVNRIFQAPNYAERRRRIEDFVCVIDSRQSRKMSEADDLDSLRNRSNGYLHTHSVQQCFDTRTNSRSRTEPSLGRALSHAHPSLRSVWIPSAEATLLTKNVVSSLDQVKSPNECINVLVGDELDSGFAAFNLDVLTLTE